MTSSADRPHLLPIGSVLAQRYRLMREIGSGAVGTVFEAETPEGRRVAVKTLRQQAQGAQATELLTRFIREAQVSASLSSPHIVQTFDGGIDEELGVPYLVMELLKGEDLGTLSQRLGPIHPVTAVRMILQAGQGLSVAHKAGVVHRDIKPSNLFVEETAQSCVVKVCDFGIAKQESEEAQLTATGVRLGSPLYMSPEQVRSAKGAGPRSDVWSLAMTLYEALAGQAALGHLTTFPELVIWLTMEDIPHIQEAAPWVDPQLAMILHGALIREVEARCPSVDEFLDALLPHAAGGTSLTPFMLKGPAAELRARQADRVKYPASWKAVRASITETAAGTVVPRAAAETQTLVGQLLGGRYRLERLLGKGGMGAVYECADEGDPARPHHAIKVVLGAEPNADAMKRFVREARAAMSIHSEYVVRVIDADTDPERGTPYIVMELLHGEDLDQLVKHGGALEPSAVARVFIEAARGLETAHEMGVVHRDIKPANLFLHELPGGQLVTKICDFGIAKQTSVDSAQTSELTHTGGIIGSPMFMSPEQARSAKHVDHRTDIWSLCISMYQALAGQKPWDSGGALGELIIAICTQDLTPLQDVAPWVPPALADAAHRGVQRDPALRYARIAELAAALEPFALPAEKLTRAALLSLTDSRRSLPAERSTGLGASRSTAGSLPHVSLSEPAASMSHSLPTMPAVVPPPPPARPLWIPVAVGAALALAGVGALSLRQGSNNGSGAAATATTSAATTSQAAAAATSAPAATSSLPPSPATRVTGKLVVKPGSAKVTVNGDPRELNAQGEVTLEGEAGDLFDIVADTGKARTESRVALSRDGSVSPRILVVVGAIGGSGPHLGKVNPPSGGPTTPATSDPIVTTPKPRETF